MADLYPVINVIETGANIRRLMDERGMTTGTLRKIFGFNTPAAFYKWFDGRAMPTIDHLVVLAKIFECSIDDILIVVDVERNNWDVI